MTLKAVDIAQAINYSDPVMLFNCLLDQPPSVEIIHIYKNLC